MNANIVLSLVVVLLFVGRVGAVDTVSVGSVRICSGDQSLLVPAQAVLDSGILDYFAVTLAGKTYESVLGLACEAKDLHTALLLINAKPGGITYWKKPENYGIERMYGDSLDVQVVVQNGNSVSRLSAFDLFTPRDPAVRKKWTAGEIKASWIFNGSLFVEYGQPKQMIHEASRSGSCIAIRTDQGAEMNLSYISGSPYAGGSQGFEVNKEKIKALKGSTLFLRIARAKTGGQ